MKIVFENNQSVDMPYPAWVISKHMGLVGGLLVVSYQLDPDREECFLWHLWDAVKCWWHCRKY